MTAKSFRKLVSRSWTQGGEGILPPPAEGWPVRLPAVRDSDGDRRQESGFSLIEMLIAIVVLSVGTLALAALIPRALQTNMNSRYDTSGTVMAQREVEQIRVQPLTAASFVDRDGNTVNLGAGGAPLDGNGNIDFTQAVVAGYSATITDARGDTFDLRWNVQSGAGGNTKVFTIAARLSNTGTAGTLPLLPPVNLRLLVAR